LSASVVGIGCWRRSLGSSCSFLLAARSLAPHVQHGSRAEMAAGQVHAAHVADPGEQHPGGRCENLDSHGRRDSHEAGSLRLAGVLRRNRGQGQHPPLHLLPDALRDQDPVSPLPFLRAGGDDLVRILATESGALQVEISPPALGARQEQVGQDILGARADGGVAPAECRPSLAHGNLVAHGRRHARRSASLAVVLEMPKQSEPALDDFVLLVRVPARTVSGG
jgi:hypothetical protein